MCEKERLQFAILAALALANLSGCDLFSLPAETSTGGDPAPTVEVVAEEDTDDEGIVATEPAAESGGDDYDRQKAEAGVGKKGRGYGGGVVTEPIRAMFRTEQRLQLMNMDRAMKMYKASNGYFPKTQEVFMKEIIEANSIQLPELPEGERYVYDTEKSELMVERPKP